MSESGYRDGVAKESAQAAPGLEQALGWLTVDDFYAAGHGDGPLDRSLEQVGHRIHLATTLRTSARSARRQPATVRALTPFGLRARRAHPLSFSLSAHERTLPVRMTLLPSTPTPIRWASSWALRTTACTLGLGFELAPMAPVAFDERVRPRRTPRTRRIEVDILTPLAETSQDVFCPDPGVLHFVGAGEQ